MRNTFHLAVLAGVDMIASTPGTNAKVFLKGLTSVSNVGFPGNFYIASIPVIQKMRPASEPGQSTITLVPGTFCKEASRCAPSPYCWPVDSVFRVNAVAVGMDRVDGNSVATGYDLYLIDMDVYTNHVIDPACIASFGECVGGRCVPRCQQDQCKTPESCLHIRACMHPHSCLNSEHATRCAQAC